MNKSNEQDDALDRLEAALGWQRKFGPMSSTQMDECVTSLATVREALERLREGLREIADSDLTMPGIIRRKARSLLAGPADAARGRTFVLDTPPAGEPDAEAHADGGGAK